MFELGFAMEGTSVFLIPMFKKFVTRTGPFHKGIKVSKSFPSRRRITALSEQMENGLFVFMAKCTTRWSNYSYFSKILSCENSSICQKRNEGVDLRDFVRVPNSLPQSCLGEGDQFFLQKMKTFLD